MSLAGEAGKGAGFPTRSDRFTTLPSNLVLVASPDRLSASPNAPWSGAAHRYGVCPQTMKSTFGFIVALALCGLSAFARDSLAVRLVGPEHVPLSGSSLNFWDLPYEIEFTWDRDVPLNLDLYVSNGAIKAGPYVSFTLRDTHGREVEVAFFVSMPTGPDGRITVRKGQYLRVPIYAWNGIAQVKLGEPYTISARLAAASGREGIDLISDTRRVIFYKR